MSSFAFILLSNGTFGGAQRRFTNLFIAFRKQFPESAWFFVSPSMKRQIEAIYGTNALDGLLAVGPDYAQVASGQTISVVQNKASQTRLIGLLKSSFLYKAYFYYKTRKAQYALFREIDALAKRHSIDRFLAVYTGVLPLYFYFGSKKRPRIVFVNMDSWFSHLSETPQADWYRQFDLFHRAHSESDLVDILSPFILEGLNKRGIHLEHQRYRITECSFTDYARCKVGEKKQFTFVFAARLEKDKNPMVFLNAAMQLADEYPEARFVLAGDGRLSHTIRETIDTAKKSTIRFMGFVASLPEILSESTVFVSLQSDNNYPSQSVLEAMACGNAIIATDVGDTRMFINEQNGWLIGHGVDSLVESMRICLKNQDAVKSKGLFAANFVRENFTLERAVAYYSSIIFPANESNA